MAGTPKTLKEIRERIQVDLDLQEEKFILDDEINAYINDGIRDAEAEISTVGPEHQNYFLTFKKIGTVANQSEYKMPTDMYIDKVRGLIYQQNNFNIHKITPVRAFEDVPFIAQDTSFQSFQYIFTQGKKGTRMVLYPTPSLTAADVITVWYVRNARILEVDTDECDIPEFVNFVLAYGKAECLKKEGHPGLGGQLAELERQRTLMVNTLRNRIIDDENTIQPEVQHYFDMMYL